jgi:hypothetical protein
VRTASRMYSYISKQKPDQDKLCHYIRIGYLTLALQCTALKSWAWSAWPRPRGFQWRFAVSVITFTRRLRCTSHYQDPPGIMSHTIVLREEESVGRTRTSLCEAHTSVLRGLISTSVHHLFPLLVQLSESRGGFLKIASLHRPAVFCHRSSSYRRATDCNTTNSTQRNIRIQ